jgi:hypothetical protein
MGRKIYANSLEIEAKVNLLSQLKESIQPLTENFLRAGFNLEVDVQLIELSIYKKSRSNSIIFTKNGSGGRQ